MFSLFPIRSVSQLVQLPHASSASSVIAFTPIFCIFVSLGLFIFDTTILILFDYFRITPLLMIDDFVSMGCCIGFVLSCSLFLPGGRASVYLSHNEEFTRPSKFHMFMKHNSYRFPYFMNFMKSFHEVYFRDFRTLYFSLQKIKVC